MAPALLLAALLALVAVPAWAHAMLEGSTPADGAVLDATPAEVVLRFNEVVTPVSVRVIDADGRAIATAAPPAGDSVALPMPALAHGSYLVSFRVVSADTHPIGGSIVFTVGAAAAAPLAATADPREAAWRVAAIAVRGLRDACLLFATGGALFIVLVLARDDPAAARLAPALRIGAALAALLSLAAIGVVGGLVTLAPSPLDAAAWRFGLATTAAPSALATAAGASMIAAALPARAAPARALALLGALAAAAGPALTGHAAAAGLAAQLLEALHTLAAAFWLGALWPLLALGRGGDVAAAARRFSTPAALAVATLAICGASLALIHGGGLTALLASDYGALLAFKLAGLAGLLAVAAVNRWWLVPRLARAAHYRGGFAAALRADLVLGGLVIAVTAILVHTAPPHDASADHDHAGPDAPAHRTHEQLREEDASGVVVAFSGGRTMLLEVEPGRAGRNTVTVAFSESGATFLPRAVRIELAQRDAGIEPIARAATPTGDGRFQLAGPELALPGAWSVRVEALVSDFEKAIFETRVVIR